MIDFTQIRAAIPLAAFVEHAGVPLRPEGEVFRGKCPLHRERRGASLVVYPDQHWFCHGKCHRGGDVVTFAQLLWSLPNVQNAVQRLFENDSYLKTDAMRMEHSVKTWQAKWPKRELDAIDEIVRDGPSLRYLWDLSPIHFDARKSHSEAIIDCIFPGNPFLCIGKTDFVFATRRRQVWRGNLSRFPLLVPSPMLHPCGVTQSGRLSEHTLDAVAGRVYLVIEFDFSKTENDGSPTLFAPLIDAWDKSSISIADACSALLWHLATLKTTLPFVMAVHSGGKSLHGWFNAYPLAEEQIWPFMRYAYQIGADHVTWCPSQFVRIPDGTRQDGRFQPVFYLNADNAVTHHPESRDDRSPSQLCRTKKE
jgi:hypothetical protein